MKLFNGVVCHIDHRAVGPRHDPYDCETVTLSRGDVTAEWESNGLGSDHVTIKRGNDVVFDRLWYDSTDKKKNRANRTIAIIHVRRAVGITPQEAEDEYHMRYRPDPMGNISRYE